MDFLKRLFLYLLLMVVVLVVNVVILVPLNRLPQCISIPVLIGTTILPIYGFYVWLFPRTA